MPKKVDSIRLPKKEVAKITEDNLEVSKPQPINTEVSSKRGMNLKRLIKVFLIIFGVIAVFIGAAAVASIQHEKKYNDKAFPGVVVWGEEVGGKSFEEISKVIDKKITSTKLKLDGPDQEYSATVLDLGVMVNTEDMVLSALAKGREENSFLKYWNRGKLLFAIYGVTYDEFAKVDPSFELNEATLDQYIDKVVSNVNIAPKDSQVTVSGGSVNIVPAVFGREVNKDGLRQKILEEVKYLKNSEVKIETRELRPNIVDKAAEEVKVQTESVISRPVILTFEGQEYRPNRETVASWISYTKKENEPNYTLVVDPAKMNNYFSFLRTKINIAYVPKKIRVENGVKSTVLNEGKDGRAIDERILGQKISQLLPIQPSVNLVIPTYVVPYKTTYENVIVADWNKYIEVNIATQTMTAYLKGGQVVASWKITTGSNGWNTPTGTFLIQRKSGAGGQPGQYGGGVCMPNPPSTQKLCGINYVSYFTPQGHAIHEAWWRYPGSWNDFGNPNYLYNGSHGCVNASYDVARFIYDWAPLGTPVIIH